MLTAKIMGFCGQLHSWSVVNQEIGRALLHKGYQVDFFATDGIKHFPNDLKPYLIGHTELNSQILVGKQPSKEYDLQFSYTAPINFPRYLSNGKKNRIGQWCYEWSGPNTLPDGFAKPCITSCDIVAAPSEFAKQVFIQSKVPASKIQVLTHGIPREFFNGTNTIELKTNKRFKILTVLAQNHIRKNIPGLLKAYGEAFTKNDDVCLILKAKDKPTKFPFDVSLKDCLQDFYRQYPNHADIMLLSEFITDMSALYRSVDTVYTLANCEGFYIPGLEGLASGKLNIAPNYGGQLDFLNADNSLLIDGKETMANPKSMYWQSKKSIWFEPDVMDAAAKLRQAQQIHQQTNIRLLQQREALQSKYSWDAVTNQLLSYTTP